MPLISQTVDVSVQPQDFSGIALHIMSDASSSHTARTFLIDAGFGIFL
jgi:hypothetical protein